MCHRPPLWTRGAPAVIERVIASQELPPGLNASQVRKAISVFWEETVRECMKA